MPKLKPETIIPTAAQDRAITAAARRDPDAKPLTEAQWKVAAPTVHLGRPRKAAPKQAVKLRLDPDVLAALRATGAGWQTRVNAMLRKRLALRDRS
jgi:uncharacterized protein (DUF4415 family)